MRRTLGIATALCMIFGGVALADHGRVVVRDHRAPAPAVVHGGGGYGGGPVVRDHRGPAPVAHVRVDHGRYVFPGGVVRTYRAPVIREHYYNMHVRPALVVENYEPVPGYVWMRGGWTWGGAEWVWTPGYFAPASQPVVTGGVGVGFSAGVTIQ